MEIVGMPLLWEKQRHFFWCGDCCPADAVKAHSSAFMRDSSQVKALGSK